MKRYRNYIFLFVTFFVVYILFKSLTSYVDLPRFCIIDVSGDIVKGNERTIKKAVKLLKEQDSEAYFVLCKYVNRIAEKYCISHDLPPSYSDTAGCYIRSTKTIYLKPDKSETPDAIKKKAETIKLYSSKSKNYWEVK